MREFGSAVEEILRDNDLDPASNQPDEHAIYEGWSVRKSTFTEGGFNQQIVRLCDFDKRMIGEGMGDTTREAFLAAVADAISPGPSGRPTAFDPCK